MQLENGNLYCWQWDTKQRLIIEEIDENLSNYIYIGNPKDKVGLYKMEIYDESGILYCDIPNEILQFAGTANIYLSEVSADKINTTAFWRFTIKEREKPMDYVFYPTEQITIEMIMEELKKTQDMVDPNTIQEEIHNYFVENPLSEQELDPVATKAIEKHNNITSAHPYLREEINKLNRNKQNVITGALANLTDNFLSTNKILVSDHSGRISTSHLEADQLQYLHQDYQNNVINGIDSMSNGSLTWDGVVGDKEFVTLMEEEDIKIIAVRVSEEIPPIGFLGSDICPYVTVRNMLPDSMTSPFSTPTFITEKVELVKESENVYFAEYGRRPAGRARCG